MSNSEQQAQQPAIDRQVQDLVILFAERDLRTIQRYVEEIEARFAALGIPATTLRYGLSPKEQGYIVVESARRIPAGELRTLREDERVRDVICYDAPCFEQERQAEQAAQARGIAQPSQLRGGDQGGFLHLPALPAGYHALTTPQLLLNPVDDRWVVPAYGTLEARDGGGHGVLVYDAGQDEQQHVAFFVQEEVIALLDHLLYWAPYFLGLCSERYQTQQAERIKRIRECVWAYIGLLPPGNKEAHQQAQNPPASIQELLNWLAHHHLHLVPGEGTGKYWLFPDDEEAQQ